MILLSDSSWTHACLIFFFPPLLAPVLLRVGAVSSIMVAC